MVMAVEAFPIHVFDLFTRKEPEFGVLPDNRPVKWVAGVKVRGRKSLDERFRIGEVKEGDKVVRIFYDADTQWLQTGWWRKRDNTSILWHPASNTFPMTWACNIMRGNNPTDVIPKP